MAETLRLVPRTPTETLLNFLYRQRLWLNEADIRETMSEAVHVLMDMEINRMLDAGRYERNDARRAYRNGYRESTWQTALGTIELRIPKLRKGSYYPIFLNEDVLIDFALDAYVLGVNMPMVENLSVELGLVRPERREQVELCERLEDTISALRESRLHVQLNRLRFHLLQSEVEQNGRKLAVQIAVALGEDMEGKTHFVAHEITREADETFWADFIRRLERRGVERAQTGFGDIVGARREINRNLSVLSQVPRPIMLQEVMVDVKVRLPVDDTHRTVQKPLGILSFDFRSSIGVAA